MERERTRVAEAAGFGVLVLGASAGGQAAILAILRDLPLDFDVPIVVVQHLPVQSSILDVYASRLPFKFEWVDEDSRLGARTVLLCPPRSCIELLPDGTFRVEPCEGGALDKPIDRLLRSVARSFSHRAIAVVLTGMGNDGAAGARELHDAGGRVLVQTESSAEFAEMPRSAIAAGAAELVVPLADMAQVLGDLVAGTVKPKARSELEAIESVFGSEGELAAVARRVDWSRTPIGPALQWPAELRPIVRTAMESPQPTSVWWGRQAMLIYNQAYRSFLGASKHPAALGRPARETWSEIWNDIGPVVDRVTKEGVAIHEEDFRFLIDRHGFVEEVFVNFGFSPIRDPRGAVVGLHNTCWETTQKVVAQRRMETLRQLATNVGGAGTPRHACEQAAAALSSNALDLPFSLLYLFDAERRQATLAGAAGLLPGSDAAPHVLPLAGAHDTWALRRLIESAPTAASPGLLLEDLDRRLPELGRLVAGTGGTPVPHSVFVLPLQGGKEKPATGAVVVGLSPHRPFDEDYRNFVSLVARQVSAGLAEARARHLERDQRERLAELDRAKTEFFANVSHEFRTPLTLLLSPLEELEHRRNELPPDLARETDLAVRNSRRLLRLVNSLLDFSQIEERRQRAVLQPTDLAALTADIASAFRSAIERAGLTLRVQCGDDLPLVPVDREMWETIVSNLLSNALKFTFEGEIAVRLRALSLHVELVVTDTGIGIPKHEIAHVFKRFHRVRGARARTIEGSGIGLSVVHDLVSRMGGQLQVHSSEGRGTAFTIWMPVKSFRQTFEGRGADGVHAPAARIAAGLAEEAQTWVDDRAAAGALDELLGTPKGGHLRLGPGARVLVADDNADLRDYLRRLLGAYWKVTVVADGAEALEVARREPPDLIVADVMMPNLDGFALLRAVRADEALKNTPVVFLTARAGEDTAIEGLLAGADDYLAKPFSARELIARVGGQITLSRARRRTQELNAFLVRFSDAVRGQVDSREIGQIACRMLHRQLGVERAYWAEVDSATREYVVVGGAHSPGVSVIEGRFPMDAWEPFSSAHRERVSHVVDDTRNDPRISETMKAGYAGIGVGADLASPVVVDGALRCVLAVNQREARRWTSDEIALVEGVAGRCWAEVERARGEAAARRAERRAEAILERISDAHNVLDREFRIVVVNAAAERLLGQPRAALLGRSHWEAFPGSVDAPVGGVLRRVVAEGVEQHLTHHYTGEGYDFHLELDAYPTDEGGVAMFWRDVTERVRAEAALRESEAKFRTMFESIDEGLLIHEVIRDGSGAAVDYRLLEINPAYTRMTGLPRDAVGKLGSEFMPHVERHWLDLFDRVACTGKPERAEMYNQPTSRWYNVQVSRVADHDDRIAIVFDDVTARKEAELARRESEERQAFLLELSDALRAEPDADAVARRAIGLLAAAMQLDRCYIAFYRPADDEVDFPYQVGNESVPPLPGKVRLSDFPETYEQVLGKTFVVEDGFERKGLSETERANGRALGMRAMVASTVRKGGDNPLRSMAAVSSRPRRWTQGDIALVEEAAERTWAAMERARAEQAVRESEAKYRTLFASIDEGFCIAEVIFDPGDRPVDYRFVEVNPAFAGQTGIEDAEGRLMRDIAPLHEEHWFEIYGKVALTGKPVRFQDEARQLHRCYDVYAFPVDGPERRRVGILFQDITERKRAESELIRSNELLRTTFDSSFQIIQLFKAVRDPAGAIVDFEWVLTNKQWNDRWGPMAGKRLLKQNPAVVESGVWDRFIQVIGSGIPVTHEHYYAHEQFDGWFLQTIAKAEDGILLSTLDVTDLRRAELKLRESEERAGSAPGAAGPS